MLLLQQINISLTYQLKTNNRESMKILRKHKTSKGNELEFCTFDNLPKNTIVVIDNSCQMQRAYTIGSTQELNNFDKVLITDFKQVINAWTNEELHF